MPTSNSWDANTYNKHASFVSNLALPVVDLLAPEKDELILDLGCGDGSLAVEIQKFGANVIAVDRSQKMVEASQSKGIQSHTFCATELPFTEKFDAVFSNAVLHWVDNHQLALEKIYTSLKKQGRFIAEFGGFGNIAHLIQAMQTVFDNNKTFGTFVNPWYFPSENEYYQLLEAQGFEVQNMSLITRPTKIDDINNWLDIFANGIIGSLTQDQQKQFKKEVHDILKPLLYTKEDGWVADYVRLRFKAHKNS